MPKKNSSYWKQRFDQIEQAANNKSVKYTKQLEKKYRAAAQQLDGKINAWYQRLADNNGVSITEAKKLLTRSELKEFKWTVEEYIKYGRENAIDQRWMKELENASAKFHINRLEALKLEARQQVEQLFAGGQEAMFDTLASVYKDTFYHSCFEIQKGVGVGFDVSALDDKKVSKLLIKPWSVDETNFSQKLWGNKRKLINNLDQELSRMVLTGESPQRAIANIRKAMDTSQNAAKRLVLTEQAYFTSVAQQDAYGELDVEEYEFVSTFDLKACDECGELNGQHFPVTEMNVGVNAPPMHPYCRCTTAPYFNDEFTIHDKRAAKNEETGEWYEIPADMSYREWKNAMVDNVQEGDWKKKMIETIDKLHDHEPIGVNNLPKKYLDDIQIIINDSPKLVREFTLKKLQEVRIINEKYLGRANAGKMGIRFNLKKQRTDERGAYTAFFHELGHALDGIYGDRSILHMFKMSLQNDFNNVVKSYCKYYNVDEENAFNMIGKSLIGSKLHSVSDLCGGMSDNKCVGKYGHKEEYWKNMQNALEKEAFAHFYEATIRNDHDKLSAITQMFPNAYKIFEDMLR